MARAHREPLPGGDLHRQPLCCGVLYAERFRYAERRRTGSSQPIDGRFQLSAVHAVGHVDELVERLEFVSRGKPDLADLSPLPAAAQVGSPPKAKHSHLRRIAFEKSVHGLRGGVGHDEYRPSVRAFDLSGHSADRAHHSRRNADLVRMRRWDDRAGNDLTGGRIARNGFRERPAYVYSDANGHGLTNARDCLLLGLGRRFRRRLCGLVPRLSTRKYEEGPHGTKDIDRR